MFSSLARRFSRLGYLVLATSACMIFGSASIEAADAKKQAVKDLASAAKSALKGFKNLSKAHRLEAEAQLDAIDQKIELGIASKLTVSDVFHALDAFQVDLASDIKSTQTTFTLQKALIIIHFEAAGFTAFSELPKDFYCGRPGICESLHVDVNRAISDVYETLGKRVQKTASRFEKELGIGVNFRMSAPEEFQETSYGGGFSSNPLTIDLLVAGSDRTVVNDGIVLISGRGFNNDGLLNIGVAEKYSVDTVIGQASADSTGRFYFVETNRQEGDRMYMVRHPTKIAGQALASITVP